MNIPTKYGFGSTPKADNKIRIKGSTDYILLLCVILLVAIGIVMVFSSSYYTAGRGKIGDIYYYLKKYICYYIANHSNFFPLLIRELRT